MEDVERRIAEIEQDREHGATFLTTQAVRALSAAASACPPGDDWECSLARVAERVAAAQPPMAGMRNAVHSLLGQMLELGPREGRRMAQGLAERLLAHLREAADLAAFNAGRLLRSGETVATCSYSSAVIRALKEAQTSGKEVRALVCEPLAEQDSPGRRLAAALRSHGLEARILDGPVTAAAVSTAQVALVGADAVAPGIVVNGAPTLRLARAADGQMPFYVVCETVKFTREAGVRPGFDEVPASLVTAIVTEEGLMAPEDVRLRVG